MKELADRVMVTWSLTEPYGNIQDFSWTPTVNRFQAVLAKDGRVEMSYQQMAAKDAIVGLYPLAAEGSERPLGTLSGEEHPAIAPHLDIRNVKLAAVDGLLLKVTLEMRGPALPESDPEVVGLAYRRAFRRRGVDDPGRRRTRRREPVCGDWVGSFQNGEDRWEQDLG